MPISPLANAPVRPPNWSPHRTVMTADGNPPIVGATLPRTKGVSADNFRYGLVRVRPVNTVTAMTIRVLFWDEAVSPGGAWVADPTIINVTLATPYYTMYSFEAMGRAFIVTVISMTGTNPGAAIETAVFGEIPINR